MGSLSSFDSIGNFYQRFWCQIKIADLIDFFSTHQVFFDVTWLTSTDSPIFSTYRAHFSDSTKRYFWRPGFFDRPDFLDQTDVFDPNWRPNFLDRTDFSDRVVEKIGWGRSVVKIDRSRKTGVLYFRWQSGVSLFWGPILTKFCLLFLEVTIFTKVFGCHYFGSFLGGHILWEKCAQKKYTDFCFRKRKKV